MVIRYYFYWFVGLAFVAILTASFYWLTALWLFVIYIPLILLGVYDIIQKKSNILRNYPIWGHWRYIFLKIRPQIQQYFINSNQNGMPFNKEMRDLIYERAGKIEDVLPFGTQLDVNKVGYVWINHSMSPTKPNIDILRVLVGGPQCKKPYLASRLNVSAMSFGAISPEAIRALNRGAFMGKFAQDTGEGGLSNYHLLEKGDIIWEIGSGYFGCRTIDGEFDPELFQKKAMLDNVKMIEIKISQGAKPAHGAILPGDKVNREIAEARGVAVGEDCLSPASHPEFSTPLELMHFVKKLRDLSGGKPTGFKLCVGICGEFMGVCKAMLETKIYPDFIVIDGSEGGTGAAPVEFSNSIGMPLNEGLIFAHNCLTGINLRQHIRLIASGKIVTGFDIATKIALGADICNMARGMMFALGCVQSRRCHTNMCPTGVATQDPRRRYALNVDQRAPEVKNFHENTLKSFLNVLSATGLTRPEELNPSLIMCRVSKEKALSHSELYEFLVPGALLNESAPARYNKLWSQATANCFTPKLNKHDSG